MFGGCAAASDDSAVCMLQQGSKSGFTFVSLGGTGLHFVGSYVVNCVDSSLDGGG